MELILRKHLKSSGLCFSKEMASSDSDSGCSVGLASSDSECCLNESVTLSKFQSDFQKFLDVGEQLCSFIQSVDVCPGVEDAFAHKKIKITERIESTSVQGQSFCLWESYDTIIATVKFPCLPLRGHAKCKAFSLLCLQEEMKDKVLQSNKPKKAILLNDTQCRYLRKEELSGIVDIAQFLHEHSSCECNLQKPIVFWECVMCCEPLLLTGPLVVNHSLSTEGVVLRHCNKEMDAKCFELCC